MPQIIYADSVTKAVTLSQAADAFRLVISNNWRESTGYSFNINGKSYTWSQNNTNSSSGISGASVATLMASRLNQVFGSVATFTGINGVVYAKAKGNSKLSVSLDLSLGYGPADQNVTAYVSTGTSQLNEINTSSQPFEEGVTLYAPSLTSDPEGIDLSLPLIYQWYKDSAKLTNFTSASLEIPKNGEGNYSVDVTYLDKAGFVSTLHSNDVSIKKIDNGQGLIGSITSSRPGIFIEGVTITAPIVQADPDGDNVTPNYSYQWFKDGKALIDGTSSDYFIPKKGAGQYTVNVTYTDNQGYTKTLVSNPVGVVRSILVVNDVLISNNEIRVNFADDLFVTGSTNLNTEQLRLLVDGKVRTFSDIKIGSNYIVFSVTGRSLESANSISLDYSRLMNGTARGFLSDVSGNELDVFTIGNSLTFNAKSNISKNGLADAYKNVILDGSVQVGYGNSLNNQIIGNNSNNYLDGLEGSDTLVGGLGDDTYVVDNIGDVVVEKANEGTDTVRSFLAYTLGTNLENLVLLGSEKLSGTGNEVSNKIEGNDSDNTLYGFSGDDTLIGNGGNDVLDGGVGADTMIGGRGDDTYYIENANDLTVEVNGGGNDTVISSIASWSLADQVENLQLSGQDAITGIGNKLDNTIIGNQFNNTIDGAGGRDVLTGGLGNDTFRFSTKPSFGLSKAVRITDFSVDDDRIAINSLAYGIAKDAETTFLSVSTDSGLSNALKTSTLFVYDTSTGGLYYNQNGVGTGFGTGGVFTILDNKALISGANLNLY
jgi:Ca2+-binding RTX toxin-like protein